MNTWTKEEKTQTNRSRRELRNCFFNSLPLLLLAMAPFPHLLQLLVDEVDAELLEAVGEEDLEACRRKEK
jgi:hypothetical protein